MTTPRFVLHHAPRSRSGRILWLLEEAGAAYEIAWHDLERATHKRPDYLAVNPFGKVPALTDRGPAGDWQGVIVTESAAISAYVADALGVLAPAIGTPLRGAYASWMAHVPAVLEPAFADMVFPRASAAPARAIGWPDVPTAVARIEAALTDGPYLLGDLFSAADIMVGGMLQWLTGWGKLTPGPHTARYLAALEARPALARARAKDTAP